MCGLQVLYGTITEDRESIDGCLMRAKINRCEMSDDVARRMGKWLDEKVK